MDEDHEIRVTLRDVYNKVENHAKEASAMNAKLDLYIGLNTAKELKIEDHETRLRVVERWVYAMPSMAMIISVAGLVVAVLKGS